jgi:hypothetical protein
MSDDEVRLDPARANRFVDREARRDERGLLILRLHELRERGVETELYEVHTRRLAALAEHSHRLGHSLDDLTAHALLEGALARKHECHLRHCRLTSSVHSISAEPHVRPAPMPVISTSAPGSNSPSRSASASASGIEPDEVFP